MNIIIAIVALFIGCAAGYSVFRYVLKGKYNAMIEAASKEAEVIKEKKLLEVKEKFLNKKSELEKEVQARNQKILRYLISMTVGNRTDSSSNIIICTDEGSRQRLLLFHPLIKIPDSCSKIKISEQTPAFITW